MRFLRLLLAWLLAAVLAGILGSIVQTQFSLAAIAALGAPVPLDVRLLTTLRDLAGFAPMLVLLAAGGFLPAFLVAGLLQRWWPRQRTFLYALAGAMALGVILLLMDATLPVTAIGAARSPLGVAALVLAGAAGGLAFARLAPTRRAAGVA